MCSNANDQCLQSLFSSIHPSVDWSKPVIFAVLYSLSREHIVNYINSLHKYLRGVASVEAQVTGVSEEQISLNIVFVVEKPDDVEKVKRVVNEAAEELGIKDNIVVTDTPSLLSTLKYLINPST